MKKLLPAFLILLCIHATAQDSFQKTIGTANNEFASAAAATKDGGYVLAGDIYITSTNTDMYIAKLDAQGNLEWDKSIGGTQYDHATKIIQTKDGGYAVAGNSGDNHGTYMRLVKLDASGNVQWSKNFSGNKYNGANAIVQTPNGGYALGGYVQTYSNGSAGFLIITDSAGSILRSKKIFDYSFYPSIQALTNTSDGGFAAVLNARTTNSYYDMFLVKLAADASFQWAKSIGGESTDIPKFVLQTADKGYLFGGSSFSFSSAGQDMFVIKTDSTGNKKWSETIATNQYEYANDAVELPGNLYVIAGATQDSVSHLNQLYAVLLKKNGKLINSQAMISPVTAVVNAVVRSANGDVAIVGYSGSSFNNTQSEYIAKFNSHGKICGETRSAGTVTDTADLVDQTVPVINITPVISNGAGTATEQTGTVTTICAGLPENAKQSVIPENTLKALVFPNPVKEKLLLQLNAEKQTLVQIEIVSFTGKIMWKDEINIAGKSTWNIDVHAWQNGVYYVLIKNGSDTQRIGFLKE